MLFGFIWAKVKPDIRQAAVHEYYAVHRIVKEAGSAGADETESDTVADTDETYDGENDARE